MTINPPKLTSPQAGAWIQRVLYALGFAVAGSNPTSLTAGQRETVLLGSVILAAVDRYLADPSTGTPTSEQTLPASPPAQGTSSSAPPTLSQTP